MLKKTAELVERGIPNAMMMMITSVREDRKRSHDEDDIYIMMKCLFLRHKK